MPVLSSHGKSIPGNHVRLSVIMVLLIVTSHALPITAASPLLTTVLTLNLHSRVCAILNSVVLLLIISGCPETGPTAQPRVVGALKLVVSVVSIQCPIFLSLIAIVMLMLDYLHRKPATLLHAATPLLGDLRRGQPVLRLVMEVFVFVM
jgi:hypothetical protein